MHLKRHELEAFDKMLVDKYTRLDEDYRILQGKYNTLQDNYENKKKQITELKQQLEEMKNDIRESDMYKNLKRVNKTLRSRVKALQRELGNVVYRLNIKENGS